MANGFEYETALKDGMSGPARAEVQSLKALQGEIRATEAAIRGLQAEKLLYQRSGAKKAAAATGFDIAEMRLGLSGMKATIRDIKPPTETTGFFSSFSSSLLPNIVAGELAASAIKGIGSAIVSVAEDIGRLGFETAKYIVDVADFKRNAENAYEILLGTREEGEKAFKGFEDLGMAIHAPTEKAEHIAQDLLLQGEKNLGTVRHVIQAVTDLQRVGLEHGATQLESTINRSLTTGFLTLPRRVSGLGIQLPELYENLAKRLHTSVDNIKKEIKKGTLDAEVGIDELTNVLKTFIDRGKPDVGDLVELFKLGHDQFSQHFGRYFALATGQQFVFNSQHHGINVFGANGTLAQGQGQAGSQFRRIVVVSATVAFDNRRHGELWALVCRKPTVA